MNTFTEAQEQWLTALESGEYEQAKCALWKMQDGKRCYCCLGVGMELFDSGSEWMLPNCDASSRGSGASHDLVEKLHLRDELGSLKDGFDLNSRGHLASANDMGATFEEIAAFIRATPWAVFRNFEVPS